MWGLRGWWHIKRLSSMCKILYPTPAPKKTKIHTWITWTSQKDSTVLLSFLPLFGLWGRILQVAKDPELARLRSQFWFPPQCSLASLWWVYVIHAALTGDSFMSAGPVRRTKNSYICLCRQTKWPEVNMWLPMYGNIHNRACLKHAPTFMPQKKPSLNFPGKGVFCS